MARTTIKATYSLDPETERHLEEMADAWKVSRSEALRRAIRAAAEATAPRGERGIEALDRLQEALGLSEQAAGRWEKASGSERQSTSRKREGRTR
jgi:predicted transcriptional regulator